jgi:LacI family transcriptional regulator
VGKGGLISMITMKQLAEELNLSRSTVAYALANHWRAKRVSPATREKVLRKADQYGYRTNRVASSLKTRVTHTIGVLVPTISSNYISMMMDGIESVLGDTYTLLLGVSQWNAAKECRLIESFEERMVDGAIVVTAGHRETLPLLHSLRRRGVAIVQVENSFPELQADVVSPDNESFGFLLTQHLIQLGHRRIYYLRSPRVHRGTLSRAEGYEVAMRQANLLSHCLPPIPVYESSSRFEFCLGQVRKLLRESKPPLGIVANDFAGMLAALQATEEAGYQCPRDVSITGAGVAFDGEGSEGIPLTRFLRMQFTSMNWSIEDMGREAGKLLLKRLKERTKRDQDFQDVAIPGHLIIGQSTSSPRNTLGKPDILQKQN